MGTIRQPKRIYAEDPPSYTLPREVIPVPAEEFEKLCNQADTSTRLDVLEVKVDTAMDAIDRVEAKMDTQHTALLEAVIAQNKAAHENNPLKNTSVQVILAVAFLIVIGAAVGKDFVLDTPTVDVTTTESP